MASKADCLKSGCKISSLLLAIVLTLLVSPATFAQRPEIVVQKGHAANVVAAASSPDGKTLASASFVSSIINIWQVDSSRELHTLTGHPKQVNYIAFSPDGKTLASGGNDKTVRTGIWLLAMQFASSIPGLCASYGSPSARMDASWRRLAMKRNFA